MILPLVLTVPHSSDHIPYELRSNCNLSKEQIILFSEKNVLNIFKPMQESVHHYQEGNISRAILDLNRAKDDFSSDGIIKSKIYWGNHVLKKNLNIEEIINLLEHYYVPYHAKLSMAAEDEIILGIDCHTMPEKAPLAAADAGKIRPFICLSDNYGSCPKAWIQNLLAILKENFPNEWIAYNKPIIADNTISLHSTELPWVQLSVSQTTRIPTEIKRNKLLHAFSDFCNHMMVYGY